MNKLDALIEACESAVEGGYVLSEEHTIHVRRILEAVREDVVEADSACAEMQNRSSWCAIRIGRGERCHDCPLRYQLAVRTALEG